MAKEPGCLAKLGLLPILLGRWLLGIGLRWAGRKIMTEPYENNLWELFPSVARYGPNNVVETSLRAQEGQAISRPFGGPRQAADLSGLVFDAAQLRRQPTPENIPVDTSLVIGPRASRPIKLSIPVVIGGMAYGLALSEPTKLALGRGATRAGTLTNSGQGPWLESERREAKHLIWQYSRTDWRNNLAAIQQADGIEIQLGQGAMASVGFTVPPEKIDARLRRCLGLKQGESAVVHNRLGELAEPGGLRRLIDRLRDLSGGVPIGLKFAAGKWLEEDLDIVVAAGADFVWLDGMAGGTHGGYPILEDDFVLPTLFSLQRAGRYWGKKGLRGKMTLICGGGLKTPGDFLKTLALGADAAGIGTAALYALVHGQVLRAIPYEPPTQLVFNQGQYADRLNIDQAATSLANFLKSSVEEMTAGARALGKTALRQVNADDLVSINLDTYNTTGIPPAWLAPDHPPKPLLKRILRKH